MPHSAVLHCDPRWNWSRVQKPHVHGTCGCHGNCNTQRLQRSLCFIKWLQGMAKRMWASWHERYSITFGFAHPASCWGDFVLFFLQMETNCSKQSCCVFLPESESFSWTHLGLSLPMNVAVLDKFLKKADGCFWVLAFSVQSVHGLWLKTWSPLWQPNPDCLSVPVNNSFVSLTD